MSCYMELGRFQGVAVGDDGKSFDVVYARGLEEAYALVKEVFPKAAGVEVVENYLDDNYIVHPTRYILKTKE